MTRALIPNSTQIPDIILDRWMAELSGAELKVLLYVARRTYGFGKESDNISLSQMASGIRRRDGTWLDLGTGLSRSGVKSACNSLIERGLLIRVNNRSEQSGECEESTYRLALFSIPEGVGQKKAYLGHKKAEVGQKNVGGRPESDRGVGQKLAPQETDQETDQETAAARGQETAADAATVVEKCFVKGAARTTATLLRRERDDELGEDSPFDFNQRSKSDDDFDELVEELVVQGVGRATAMRFAREKPDTCRRCLEYLPYANIKTTKGAWLANAIRDEYGPPPGYEEGRARLSREREAESRELAKRAFQERELARRETKTTRLRTAYQQFEQTQGELLAAFNDYVRGERAKIERIALHLSAERRAELLASFEEPQRRLELFEAWIASHPTLLN